MSLTAKEEVTVDELIHMEWELMTELRKMMGDPSLSRSEKIRVANSLAYHSIAINKLLAQKGEHSEVDEETLGDFIGRVNAEGRMRRFVRPDVQGWKRRITLRK